MQPQNTDCKPVKKTGISRVLAAFTYSLDGLRSTLSTEAAFRQEVCLVAIASLVLFFLPLSNEWKGLLFLATTAVLVVELLNSAIESVVDLASSDYHVLAKRAKDIGSAAVFVSIALAVLLWTGAVCSIILENAPS
jgi:diacylglycerol kinase (ATP)